MSQIIGELLTVPSAGGQIETVNIKVIANDVTDFFYTDSLTGAQYVRYGTGTDGTVVTGTYNYVVPKNSAIYLSGATGSSVTGGETLYKSGNIFFLKASTDMVLKSGKGTID